MFSVCYCRSCTFIKSSPEYWKSLSCDYNKLWNMFFSFVINQFFLLTWVLLKHHRNTSFQIIHDAFPANCLQRVLWMYKEHHMLWNKTSPNKVHCLQPDNLANISWNQFLIKNVPFCTINVILLSVIHQRISCSNCLKIKQYSGIHFWEGFSKCINTSPLCQTCIIL